MFARFTERARMLLVYARNEARPLRHSYLGTEHILPRLLCAEEGVPARASEDRGARAAQLLDG